MRYTYEDGVTWLGFVWSVVVHCACSGRCVATRYYKNAIKSMDKQILFVQIRIDSHDCSRHATRPFEAPLREAIVHASLSNARLYCVCMPVTLFKACLGCSGPCIQCIWWPHSVARTSVASCYAVHDANSVLTKSHHPRVRFRGTVCQSPFTDCTYQHNS